MSKNNGGPAFPKSSLRQTGEQIAENDFNYEEKGQSGMSLRDYFAAKAMQYVVIGIADKESKTQEEVREDFKYASIIAYEIADAMLKAREK